MSSASNPLRSALTMLLCLPAFVWTAELLAGTPALILARAVAPAALFACAIFLAQRGSGRPFATLLFAIVWGGTGAAFLSTNGNELARVWLDLLAASNARAMTALLIAPAVEEASKALGLVVLFAFASGSFRGIRDGIVYGALVGVGFVFTENLLYLGLSMLQGGEEGLSRALYLRGVLGGSTHAVFTACAGAGLGWAAENAAPREVPMVRRVESEVPSELPVVRGAESEVPSEMPMARRAESEMPSELSMARRVVLPAAGGIAAALLQHMAWNGMAAPAIGAALCGAEAAGQSCRAVPTNAALYGEATAIALLFLAPGAVGLLIAWRSSRRP